ncbi:QRFP-like peptide receptor [Anneissia japonica]|uniref:QRFP-like peptide receptor n=1 Tax=Anneissia japonica TaxID=1529436 RepID=UPI001425A1E4|nr:QRFP-like peptide receptor [Anneissia japonica]XP_033108434.1 QRFP-like peptide receptor [Anneissia japonica]
MMATVTQEYSLLLEKTQSNLSSVQSTTMMIEYASAPFKEPLPLPTILLKSIAIAILIILTVFGNTVVIAIIVKNKQLRGTTYYYLLNLAVADIMIAVFTEWTYLVHDLKRYWIFGEFTCKFSTVIQAISVHVSILTLTIIAIDRYLAIVFPLKSRVTSRNGGAGIFILVVWMIAIAVNIPLLLHADYYEWVYDDGVFRAYCGEYWENQMMEAIYTTLLIVIVYIAPLCLMIFVYLTIATKLLISRAPGERIESTVSSQERTKRKVLKMLVVVVLTFALCWLPYNVYTICRLWIGQRLDNETDDKIHFAILWLGYANSALNPFIYCGFNQNFRKGFLQILTCNSKRYSPCNKDVYSKKTIPSQTEKTIVEQQSLM